MMGRLCGWLSMYDHVFGVLLENHWADLDQTWTDELLLGPIDIKVALSHHNKILKPNSNPYHFGQRKGKNFK